MCKLLRHEQRYSDATKLIKSLPKDIRGNSKIKMLNEIIKFNAERSDGQSSEQLTELLLANGIVLDLKKQLFIQHVFEENYEMALTQLVELMEINQSFEDNYAQAAMFRVFTLLGDNHPLISKYRPNLRRYTH